MLKEIALKYYHKDYDYNCAETILHAADEAYNMNLSKETYKVMAPFGGGLGVEDICGALSGAVAVIGILFTNERGHESPRVKELTVKLVEEFKSKLGTYNCRILKEKYKTEAERCSTMIVLAAETLEEIIEKERSR